MEPGIHELTAGYALDALDEDERRSYEEHLGGCARCQEELASFGGVTEALALAVTGPEPRPQLRSSILDAIGAERGTVIQLSSRRRWLAPALGVATATAAVVAIGLGIWALSLSNRLDTARSAADQAALTARVLADPTSRDVALKGTSDGHLVLADDGAAVLVVESLAEPPAGHAYQAWVVENGIPTSAGVFEHGSGAPFGLTTPVPHGAVVAVTLERTGGADAPTTAPIVATPPV